MSIFSNIPLKDKFSSTYIRRTFDINDLFYDKLLYLKNNIYQTSINKLIAEAIKDLIKSEDIVIYKVDKKECMSKHSLYLPESLLIELGKLNDKFPAVTISKLVNIAIYRAIVEETKKGNLTDYKSFTT